MNKLRIGVIISLTSLIAIVLFFELGRAMNWPLSIKIIEWSLLVIMPLSYFLTYLPSGLWSFTHRKIKDLDERELSVMNKALRIAYTVFALVVLSVLMIMGVFEVKISTVLAGAFILLAHMLPGAVLVFSEKNLKL